MEDFNPNKITTKFLNSFKSLNFDCKTLEKIGQGNFGRVYKMKSLASDKYYAIKHCELSKDEENSSASKETLILDKLNGIPNIVKIIDYSISKVDSSFIIMELADCSLLNMINEKENKLELKLILQIFLDLVCGLNDANKQSIGHLDLKPANILIFKENRNEIKKLQNKQVLEQNLIFKIADWGGSDSNAIGTKRPGSDTCYTEIFAAPEVLRNDKTHIHQADIYSLAKIILKMCGVTNDDLKENFNNMKKNFSDEQIMDENIEILIKEKGIDENYGGFLSYILKWCLLSNFRLRPSYDDLIDLLSNYESYVTCYERKKEFENSTYEGLIINGEKKFFGIETFSEDTITKGIFSENRLNGYGVEKSPEYTYSGYFQNGIKNGKGGIYESEFEKYEGEWYDNEKHNEGIFKNKKNGLKYNGNFKSNLFHGKGKLIENKDEFIGVFKNGNFCSVEENGSILYSNGIKFDWIVNLKNRTGKISNKDIEFQGNFINNNSVSGRIVFKNGKLDKIEKMEFNGELIYVNDKNNSDLIFNGETKYKYIDNLTEEIYQGKLVNGLKDGIGIYYYSNQSKYEGEFKKDLREGEGRLTQTSQIYYEGKFLNDDLKFGKMFLGLNQKPFYIGEFSNLLFDGRGKLDNYQFSEPYTYDGEFSKGKIHGVGTIVRKNGRYSGDFYEDDSHGKGKVTYSNGDTYEGDIDHDIKQGKGKYTFKDGSFY